MLRRSISVLVALVLVCVLLPAPVAAEEGSAGNEGQAEASGEEADGETGTEFEHGFELAELESVLTPDSPLYVVKQQNEKIRIMFTFRGQSKGELLLDLTLERALELEALEHKFAALELTEKELELLENALEELVGQAEQLVDFQLKQHGITYQPEQAEDGDEVDKYEVRIQHLREKLELLPESASQGIERAIANAERQQARKRAREEGEQRSAQGEEEWEPGEGKPPWAGAPGGRPKEEDEDVYDPTWHWPEEKAYITPRQNVIGFLDQSEPVGWAWFERTFVDGIYMTQQQFDEFYAKYYEFFTDTDITYLAVAAGEWQHEGQWVRSIDLYVFRNSARIGITYIQYFYHEQDRSHNLNFSASNHCRLVRFRRGVVTSTSTSSTHVFTHYDSDHNQFWLAALLPFAGNADPETIAVPYRE